MGTKYTGFCCIHTPLNPAEPSVLPIQGSAQPRRGTDSDVSSQHHMSDLRLFLFFHYISYLEFSRDEPKCQAKFYIFSKVLFPWLC